jgi:hypothetical protein
MAVPGVSYVWLGWLGPGVRENLQDILQRGQVAEMPVRPFRRAVVQVLLFYKALWTLLLQPIC